jgi:hypothetical protein
MRHYVAVFVAATLVMALFPSAGLAQEQPTFEDVIFLVKRGDVLSVIDRSGTFTKGKVERFSRESLRLKTWAGTREFKQPDVLEIHRHFRDSVRDGAKRGFYVGAAFGLILGLSASERGVHNGEAPLAGVVVGGVYGAALGALLDLSKNSQRTIYRADNVPGPRRLRVAPVASRDRKGVSINVSF